MSETNGERNTRLDRIERALELLIADHEHFRFDHKQLLTAQVLQKEQIDKLIAGLQAEKEERLAKQADLAQHAAALDARVDKLVSAIGEMIQRIPAR